MSRSEELLTDEELETITGYSGYAKQYQALRRNGVNCMTDRKGRPSLTWTIYNGTFLPSGATTRGQFTDFDISA